MPGFPDPFTTNADVNLKYSGEQGIENYLESGNDYDDLHTGAREAVVNYIDTHGATSSLVENPSSFKRAAVCWFLSNLFAGQSDLNKADWYDKQFFLEMERRTKPLVTSTENEEGGQVGRIVVLKRGSLDARSRTISHHYRRRNPGSRFGR